MIRLHRNAGMGETVTVANIKREAARNIRKVKSCASETPWLISVMVNWRFKVLTQVQQVSA